MDKKENKRKQQNMASRPQSAAMIVKMLMSGKKFMGGPVGAIGGILAPKKVSADSYIPHSRKKKD